jgi:hypothetical protein
MSRVEPWPRGVLIDHPRASLLRHDGLYAYLEYPVEEDAIGGEPVAECAKHFKKLHPLNEWLIDYV